MITTKINGIDVKFPFEPYDIQKEYMSKVIECLSSSQNGLLESPTGTGKTLSLLCASLAWLQTKKAALQLERQKMGEITKAEDFIARLNEQLGGKTVGMSGKSFLGLPTIIYSSRTHSQLTQAANEMKLTAYNHMNACVIGSREQLCINPEVVKEQNYSTKIAMCNIKTKTRGCYFYTNYQRRKDDPSLINQSVVDIEDLVEMGNKHKICPYFMAKEMKNRSDLIFMPYNYILEPRYRKNLGIEIANNIIILDEAHNVEKMCEESASLQIKSTDIALAIEEVTAIMKLISEESTISLNEDVEKDFSPDDLATLKQILLDFEKHFDEIPIKNRLEGQTLGGPFIFELLEKAGIRIENFQIVGTLIDKLIEFLSIVTSEGPFQRKGNGLKIVADALSIIFMDNTNEFRQRVDKCYKVHIVEEKKDKRDGWSSKPSKTSGRILNYWCFSPGFGMKMLMDEGVKCCILTSGTLAPLKPLISELELTNPIHLENPHVIGDSQICVRIISNGPDNERLTCTYQNRENENYLRSLGCTIMNMTRLIPSGLLIFFPSYPIMQKCMEFWQHNGIWSNIEAIKPVYTEPRDKVSFSNAMTEYYEKINDPTLNGAIFMGVCRGKISEGLDFADLNGRAVIIVGLPFPPLKDPRVILKKKYLDNCRSINKEFIGGDQWYTLEACRAVNQAIGRVIRHRNDYGAILLLDERFKNANIQSQLSAWLKNRVRLVQNFGQITRDLRLFYKNASEKFPLSTKKKEKYVQSSDPNEEKFSSNLPTTGAYNCFEFNSSDGSSLSSTRNSSVGENNEHSVGGSSSSSSKMLENYRKRVENQIGGISKKMKIRLIPNVSISEPENDKVQDSVSESTTEFIAMVRKAFDVPTFKIFVDVLKTYQTKKDINELTKNLDYVFLSRHSYQYLLGGVEKYVDSRHKQDFRKFLAKYSITSNNPGESTRSESINRAVPEGIKEYIALVRKELDVTIFKVFIAVLQKYQDNKDIEALKVSLDDIFSTRRSQGYLLKGVGKYVGKEHQEIFEKFCEKYG